MTGLSARTHGDRSFNERLVMPPVPTLADTFRGAGYQTFAVGKLHVFPRRSRIGFDEAIINEEGRRNIDGRADDWEMELSARGFAGMEYATGMANNDYLAMPWHLPDDLHPTNWTAREMSRAIRRRDPSKAGFWYLSFTAPHPPLCPPRDYWNMYSDDQMQLPSVGSWREAMGSRPFKCSQYGGGAMFRVDGSNEGDVRRALRAFFASQTHIDHQIRVVLGMLREENLLQDTHIVFLSDHGDMLGHHGLWAKGVMYEPSTRIPLLVVPAAGTERYSLPHRDDRLAEIRDVMPTLLDLAGIPIPGHVEGHSLLGPTRRSHLYGEHGNDLHATRMVVEGDYKLIYYPEGNRFQLFHLAEDPEEMCDLAEDPAYRGTREVLQDRLKSELYGGDEAWISEGRWVGLPATEKDFPNPNLSAQRGLRFP